MISIIIRAQNEENWIGHCLKEVFKQTYQDFEVIIVDNYSTDRTIAIAQQFPIKQIVYIDKYLPGLAINKGVEKSQGNIIVLLSAHCIPTSPTWLEKLVGNFNETHIVGVYGRQEPLPFSSDFDKRDLLITFGLDKKIQKKDSFFHNANSAIRRDILNQIPIDNSLTNIEDRVWAKAAIEAGHTLIYEPEASVYHYHGIHQNQDPERCRKIVRILEGLELVPAPKKTTNLDTDSNNSNVLLSQPSSPVIQNSDFYVDAIIPTRGSPLFHNGKCLIDYTIESLRESPFVRKIIVLTDNPTMADFAKSRDCYVPYLREVTDHEIFTDIESTLQANLMKIAELRFNLASDIVIAYPTKPFRTKNFFHHLILAHCNHLQQTNDPMASTISCYSEHEVIWVREHEGDELKQVDQGLIPRAFKNPTLISQFGLGSVTRQQSVLNKNILSGKLNLFPINNQLARIELRDEKDLDTYGEILTKWRTCN